MILAASSGETARLLLELGGVILVLAVIARASSRVGLSPIPAYLLFGLLLGTEEPFELARSAEFIESGSQIGVVLLLLLLGVEYSGEELLGSLRGSARVGAVDLVLNAVPGAIAALVLGWGPMGALFLGGITYISSSGIVAKLIGDLGRTGNRETPQILAILVMEDLAMSVYLPVVAGLLVGGSALATTGSVALALGAVAVVLLVSVRFGEQLSRVVFSRSDEVLLFTVLGLALLVAGVAESFHVSAAVGAFLVGTAISGNAADAAHGLLSPLRDLFAGAFFVFFAFEIDPLELPDVAVPVLLLAVVTAATKVATGWYAAGRAGVAVPGRFRAGFALVARGEFSIVIAGLTVGSDVDPQLRTLAAGYVLALAVLGPVLTRFGDPVVARLRARAATNRAVAAG